jgi:hypothetical protein
MITAIEAREITHSSDKAIKALLQPVEQMIRSAAEAGDSSTLYHLCSHPALLKIDFLPSHVRMVRELEKLGFTATIMMYGEQYVPRGLADDSGDGPSYINYGISIEW